MSSRELGDYRSGPLVLGTGGQQGKPESLSLAFLQLWSQSLYCSCRPAAFSCSSSLFSFIVAGNPGLTLAPCHPDSFPSSFVS